MTFQNGTVHLFTTRRCNMKCAFCSMNANEHVIPESEISLYEIKESIIPFLKRVKPRKVIITGGEPLLRRDIGDIVRGIKQEVECKVVIQTNGTLVDKEILLSLRGYVDEVDYSIAHMLHIKDKLMANAEMTKNIVTDNVLFSFVYVDNWQELCEAIEISRKMNVELTVTPVVPIGRGKNTKMSVLEQMEFYIKLAQYLLENNLCDTSLINNLFSGIYVTKACGGLGRSLAIFPEGDIYMCKCMESSTDYVGNVLSDTPEYLMERWKENVEKDEVKELFHVDYKEMCQKCEYRYLCGGICGAELMENPKDVNCFVRKTLLEFMLFRFDKQRSLSDNVRKCKLFLEEKREELLGEESSVGKENEEWKNF